jgi:hypothetical protein
MFPMLLDLLLLLLLLNKLGLINSFANQLLVKFMRLSESFWLGNSRCSLGTSRWRWRMQLTACRLRCSILMVRRMDKVMLVVVLLLPFSLKVPLAS